jgi:hypothetical protein
LTIDDIISPSAAVVPEKYGEEIGPILEAERLGLVDRRKNLRSPLIPSNQICRA